MIVTCVHVWVLSAYAEQFVEATLANHRASVSEPGNLRFDLLQVEQEPGRFMIYEAYLSDAAAAAHKETAHYKAWRAAVEPWMAQPRQGVRHQVVAPVDPMGWGKGQP